MSEVNFAKTPEAVIEISATVTPVEGVTVPNITSVAAPAPVDVAPVASIPTAPAPIVAVAAPATPLPVAKAKDPLAIDNDDNIGFEDIILPRVNIVQKVGDLSNIFPGGHIVLNQQAEIHVPVFIHATDPAQNKPGTGLLNFTVIGFKKKQFTEKVEGGKLGMLLNNEEDVARNGGTLDYNEWKASVEASKLPGGKPPIRRFERLATAIILVEKPAFLEDPAHTLFPYDFNGKYYTIALWSMKGVSYTNGAKIMFSARKIGHLRGGYTVQGWAVTTKLEKYGDNFAYRPVLRPGEVSTPEFRQFCRQIIGQE